MKNIQRFVILGCVASLFVFNMPNVLANEEAPVTNLTDPADNQPAIAAPVEEDSTDLNRQAANVSVAAGGMSADRVARLEQQMSNLTQMNMPQQIDELRQSVQQLNGQLQMQEHDIQVLSHRVQMLNTPGNAAASTVSGNVNNLSDAMESQDATMDGATAYRAAFNALVKKEYDRAKKGFKSYIARFPKGSFMANAHYWLGEIYLKTDDVQAAEKSFSTVIYQYIKSSKVPDAKFKLALIHIKDGKKDVGKNELRAIKRQYPGSTAAQLASIQLQRME